MCKTKGGDRARDRAPGQSGRQATVSTGFRNDPSDDDTARPADPSSTSNGFSVTWGGKSPPASVLDDQFVNTETDAQMPTIDKKKAARGANMLTAFASESQRSGPLSRTIGMPGLHHLLQTTPKQRPSGVKCISFLDTDARVMEVHAQNADCLAKPAGSCPTVESGSHASWNED